MINSTRFRISAVALMCLGVVSFGLYALQDDDVSRSHAKPTAQTKNASPPTSAEQSSGSEQATTVDSAVSTLAFQNRSAEIDKDLDKQTTDDTSATGDPDVESERLDPERIAKGTDDTVGDENAPQAEFVFEEMDLATVNEELRQKYAAEDHKRYRFAKIDGLALRERIQDAVNNDILSIELFPGEVTSTRQPDASRSRASGDGEMVRWHGAIEGHPCSAINIFVDPQGIVTVSSFHRHVAIFDVELTSQDSVYAVTQSMADNSRTCED